MTSLMLLASETSFAMPAGAADNSWQQAVDEGKKQFGREAYPAAEKALSQAVQTAKKDFRASDPRLAQSFKMLAALYRDEGKYGDARRVYKELLSLQEKSLPANDPEIANTLIALADGPDDGPDDAAADRTLEEDRWYRQALEILQKHDGAKPSTLQAHILQHLGVNCRIRKEYSKAEAFYQQALVSLRKSLGSDTAVLKSDPLGTDVLGVHSPDSWDAPVADNFEGLAIVYDEAGRYKDSVSAYERAVDIREKTLAHDPGSFGLGSTLRGYAAALMKAGRKNDAEKVEARIQKMHVPPPM